MGLRRDSRGSHAVSLTCPSSVLDSSIRVRFLLRSPTPTSKLPMTCSNSATLSSCRLHLHRLSYTYGDRSMNSCFHRLSNVSLIPCSRQICAALLTPVSTSRTPWALNRPLNDCRFCMALSPLSGGYPSLTKVSSFWGPVHCARLTFPDGEGRTECK